MQPNNELEATSIKCWQTWDTMSLFIKVVDDILRAWSRMYI